jgi:hypothetical protein
LIFLRLYIKTTLSVLCALAIFTCVRNAGQEVTSTSVTTGNPTGIRILFKRDTLPVSISGHVDFFATTQIPLPSYSPNPILRANISNANEFQLEPDILMGIADSLWPKTSIDADSIYHFNLVVSDSSVGILLKDFGWNKKNNSFRIQLSNGELIDENQKMDLNGNLVLLKEVVCNIDPVTMSPDRTNILFIYGTGFWTIEKNGRFVFPALPKGEYELAHAGLPGRDRPTSRFDSLDIYGINKKISTEKENFLIIKGIIEEIPLSDSLKVP